MSFLFPLTIETIMSKSLSRQNKFHPFQTFQPNYKDLIHKLSEEERTWKIPFFPTREQWGSASLTVEASLGLTLFLLFMTSLCQLFLVIQLQIRVQKALEQVSGEAARYSCLNGQINLWDSEPRLIGAIEEELLAELSEEALRLRFLNVADPDYLDHSLAEGGRDGFSLEESSILQDGHWIRLTVTYRIRLPMAALGLTSYEVTQTTCRYAWLGDKEPQKKQEESREQTVYVTNDSQVYHLSLSCTYLNLSVRSISPSQLDSLRNDSGARYYACELCRPDMGASVVYITGSGTRYHGDRECGAITRNVTGIPISQVGDRRPCSRCGQTEE